MNWKKIKEQYPAAWEAFALWNFRMEPRRSFEIINGGEHSGKLRVGLADLDQAMDGDFFHTRDLYGFFDGKGIYVVVELDQMGGSNGKPSFLATIFNSDPSADEEECLDGNFKTRTEAEAAAFERAFSILNNQLLGE